MGIRVSSVIGFQLYASNSSLIFFDIKQAVSAHPPDLE